VKESLKTAIRAGRVSGTVIDCWEKEPDIDTVLLELVDLGTPHIAGYSKDGKAKGTSMSVQALSRFFGLGIDDWECKDVELPSSTLIEIDGTGKTEQQILREAVLATYDIRNDDKALRNAIESFEKLRGDYPVRREFPVFEIKTNNVDKGVIEKLLNLGFRINF
jgi:erythronate-4-phosphate dehydrogenase